MRGLELTIAIDFLSKFSLVRELNRYSPRASAIAKRCQQLYPAESGVYSIKQSHIVEATNVLGIKYKILRDGEVQIGISADDFRAYKTHGVFSNILICKNGFTRYTYILDKKNEPILKPICSHCKNGFESPIQIDVEKAKEWLLGKVESAPVSSGAVLLAAQELGFFFENPLRCNFHININPSNRRS